jgi:hypothetical protein
MGITIPRAVFREPIMINLTYKKQTVVQTARHGFPQAENQPTKAREHRYERRRVKEHLRVSAWDTPEEE